jgi:hypothetical protein
MSKYHCRIVLPEPSEWYEVEGSSPGDAIQNFHLERVPRFYENKKGQPGGVRYIRRTEDKREDIYFARIEVEIEEYNDVFTSKIYSSGIWRKGVKFWPDPTIEKIAKAIGWKRDPKELLEDWGEESIEDAIRRTNQSRRP